MSTKQQQNTNGGTSHRRKTISELEVKKVYRLKAHVDLRAWEAAERAIRITYDQYGYVPDGLLKVRLHPNDTFMVVERPRKLENVVPYPLSEARQCDMYQNYVVKIIGTDVLGWIVVNDEYTIFQELSPDDPECN